MKAEMSLQSFEKQRNGVGRPRKVDISATRAKILEAARQCFAEYGYRMSTNRRVAARAGLSEGAVFHHFRTKKSLYIAANADLMTELLGIFECSLLGKSTLATFAEAYRETAIKVVKEHAAWAPYLARVEVEASVNPEIREAAYIEKLSSFFSRALDEPTHSGDIEARQKQQLVPVFVAMTYGLSLYVASRSDEQFMQAINGFSLLMGASSSSTPGT